MTSLNVCTLGSVLFTPTLFKYWIFTFGNILNFSKIVHFQRYFEEFIGKLLGIHFRKYFEEFIRKLLAHIFGNISKNLSENLWAYIFGNILKNLLENFWAFIFGNVLKNLSENFWAYFFGKILKNLSENLWAYISGNILKNLSENFWAALRAAQNFSEIWFFSKTILLTFLPNRYRYFTPALLFSDFSILLWFQNPHLPSFGVLKTCLSLPIYCQPKNAQNVCKTQSKANEYLKFTIV